MNSSYIVLYIYQIHKNTKLLAFIVQDSFFFLFYYCFTVTSTYAELNFPIITTKSPFSRIHNSMIFYLKNTKVTVEVPTYEGRLHTKFEENRVKSFQDMSEQTFEFFVHFFLRLFAHLKNHFNSQTCTPIQLKISILV